MIIDQHANLSAISERLGGEATEGDAQTALDNLLEAGWSGWDLVDIPEDILLAAAIGPVEGPDED
jgi:hypothetical protein